MSQTTMAIPTQRTMQVRRVNSPEALFALWYAEYPRKVARGAALIAYRKALRKVAEDPQIAAAVLLDGLRRHRFNADPQYRPHPSTWLNGERWADDDGTGGIDPVLAAAGLTMEHFR